MIINLSDINDYRNGLIYQKESVTLLRDYLFVTSNGNSPKFAELVNRVRILSNTI